MSKPVCISFQKHYKGLTTKLEKNDPDLFKLGLLVAYASELDKGFGVVKQLKTYSNGTKMNYERIDTNEKAEAYRIKCQEISDSICQEVLVKDLAERIKAIDND